MAIDKKSSIRLAFLKDQYMAQWQLQPDGDSFFSYNGLLQPVLYENKSAMLKITLDEEEQAGGMLMKWWEGLGAAVVYKDAREALLMERIIGDLSLKEMAETGNDNEATRIICQTAERLHTKRDKPLPPLVDLNDRFYKLVHPDGKYGTRFSKSSRIAEELLKNTNTKTVLHGDLHHENILYDSQKGWQVIDPNPLYGNPAFEYPSLFCNPTWQVALAPGRLETQLAIVCEQTGMEPQYMLRWIVAYTALSGLWMLGADQDASNTFAINQIALTALNE